MTAGGRSETLSGARSTGIFGPASLGEWQANIGGCMGAGASRRGARFRAAGESFRALAGKGDVPCLTSPTAEQRRQAHCCSAGGLAGQANVGGGGTSGGPRCRCRGKDPSWGGWGGLPRSRPDAWRDPRCCGRVVGR